MRGASLRGRCFDTLLNPLVLVEVLSESTAAYDRGAKFEQYRTIASLRDYVLVHQDRALVEHYARQPDGSWLFRELHAGDRLELASIGCALAVDDVYRKVPLPPEPEVHATPPARATR